MKVVSSGGYNLGFSSINVIKFSASYYVNLLDIAVSYRNLELVSELSDDKYKYNFMNENEFVEFNSQSEDKIINIYEQFYAKIDNIKDKYFGHYLYEEKLQKLLEEINCKFIGRLTENKFIVTHLFGCFISLFKRDASHELKEFKILKILICEFQCFDPYLEQFVPIYEGDKIRHLCKVSPIQLIEYMIKLYKFQQYKKFSLMNESEQYEFMLKMTYQDSLFFGDYENVK